MQAAYFLLDTAAVGYSTLIEQCRVEHVKNAQGCLLAVALNRASTRALVKVAGVRQTFLRSVDVLDKCETHEEHVAKFVPMVDSAEWR